MHIYLHLGLLLCSNVLDKNSDIYIHIYIYIEIYHVVNCNFFYFYVKDEKLSSFNGQKNSGKLCAVQTLKIITFRVKSFFFMLNRFQMYCTVLWVWVFVGYKCQPVYQHFGKNLMCLVESMCHNNVSCENICFVCSRVQALQSIQ